MCKQILSCIYWFFQLNDPEIEKHFKWTLKRLKVGMVSSFHPHSMWKKVGRVMTKIRCTSCTKWTISFEVSGFRTETHLLQTDFVFLTYVNSRLFVCSKCTIPSHIINFQPFLTSFVTFHAFTDFFELYDPEIEKYFKWTLKRLKIGTISSFHPHGMC